MKIKEDQEGEINIIGRKTAGRVRLAIFDYY